MKHLLLIIAGFSAFASVAGLSGTADAESGPFFTVHGKLFGKTDDGIIKSAEDLSGIACAETSGFPRHCLLIDDESQFAQYVTIQEGSITAGGCVRVTEATYTNKKGNTKPAELDGEGVAYFDDAFYVIGSHGHPRDKKNENTDAENKAKLEASSVIQRIPVGAAASAGADCKPDQDLVGTPVVELSSLLKADSALGRYFGQRLDCNGLTVEGIAIKKKNGIPTLYAGLRGPILSGGRRAVILAVPLEANNAAPRRFELALGMGRGVRDLISYGEGFLILAGPSADPEDTDPIDPDDYAVFFWDGAGKPERLGLIEGNRNSDGKWAKPEAILPLEKKNGRLKVLILFDGAKSDNGAKSENVARADTIDAP